MRTSNDRWTSPEERYAVTMSLKLCRNFLDDFDAVGAVAVAFPPALRMALARASIHRGARTLLVRCASEKRAFYRVAPGSRRWWHPRSSSPAVGGERVGQAGGART